MFSPRCYFVEATNLEKTPAQLILELYGPFVALVAVRPAIHITNFQLQSFDRRAKKIGRVLLRPPGNPCESNTASYLCDDAYAVLLYGQRTWLAVALGS